MPNPQTPQQSSEQNPNNSGNHSQTSADNSVNKVSDAESTKIIAAGMAGADNEQETTSNYVANLGKSSSGNPWLAGNTYTAFLAVFMEIQHVLMKNKVVQGKVELNGMNLVYQAAVSTSDIIMQIAKLNQMVHIACAVMAGVSLGIAIGGFMYGAVASNMKFLSGGKFADDMRAFDRGTTIGQMSIGVSQLGNSIAHAATVTQIAELEGQKQILQAEQQLFQNQMQKAGEAIQADEDQIVQLLQTLDNIRQGLNQAINNMLHQ